MRHLSLYASIALITALSACQPCTQHACHHDDFTPSETLTEFQFEGPALLIHGGAGWVVPERYDSVELAAAHASLRRALAAGQDLLEGGAAAVDVVEHVLGILEDDSLYNAGRGAVVTEEGIAELDAAIMTGHDLNAGAVAGVRTVKNPSQLARAVLDSSRHVFLIGRGAEAFAVEQGLDVVPNDYFITHRRAQQILRWKEEHKMGTVGVVVRDGQGNVAAGTSTGGMNRKQWGRVGDVPVIGAGTYANNAGAAVSCTGHGEYFIRHMIAGQVSLRHELSHQPLSHTVHHMLFNVLNVDEGSGGLIAIDSSGQAVLEFNSPGMYRGASGQINGRDTVFTALFGREPQGS